MIILTNLNFNHNEIQNAVIHPLATAPANPVAGQIYYNSGTKKLMQYDGTNWKVVGTVVEASNTNGKIKIDGEDVTVYTLPAATSESLGGVKVGSGLSVENDGTINADGKLDKSGGTMTGAIAMGSNKITGLADGVNDGDAVNKGQLDAAKLGALKPSGSVTFANLPALSASVLNNLYNVTDAFTTTSDFVEGSGKSYPAGTNVAVINTGTTANPVYKYDAMTGVIDLSGYLPANGNASNTTAAFIAAGSRTLPSTGETLAVIFGKILKYLSDLKTVAFTGSYSDLSNKPTVPVLDTATLTTSLTTKSITATGATVVSVIVIDSVTHEQVLADVTINGKTVTVTVAATPTNALEIRVLSV